ncbi:MAG: N-acetylneuraminate synthase family protein [Clostridia bacterium]|nr:N-acetylneuraminate synthase family protein [Clostridia bacterium]
MREITIKKDRKIGQGNPAYIIVDVAANHNGNLETAKELIRKAAQAGVDAVKFQTYTADQMYSKKAPQFSRDPMKPYDLIKKVEHPRSWLPVLADCAAENGVDFLSSPFDYEAVDLLQDVGVPLFKVASLEIVDLEFLKYIAQKGKPVIISTGMCNMAEIEEAVDTILSAGNENIVLLHCNTSYPTPIHIVNLNAMNTMEQAFKLPVGFSDHTLGWHIPLAAVAKGACVIEKHFTLNRKQEGPDHGFSIEPQELKIMVDQIRDIESAMGTGIKKVSQEEMENYEKGRRSLVANMAIPKGTRISREMVTTKRPGFGIKPNLIDIVIGREAKVDIDEDDILTWEMIK